jgi:hypothetical protein
MSESPPKPHGYHDQHKEYLDSLRESGRTNMFEAGRFLQSAFGLKPTQANEYLMYWMMTFKE